GRLAAHPAAPPAAGVAPAPKSRPAVPAAARADRTSPPCPRRTAAERSGRWAPLVPHPPRTARRPRPYTGRFRLPVHPLRDAAVFPNTGSATSTEVPPCCSTSGTRRLSCAGAHVDEHRGGQTGARLAAASAKAPGRPGRAPKPMRGIATPDLRRTTSSENPASAPSAPPPADPAAA